MNNKAKYPFRQVAVAVKNVDTHTDMNQLLEWFGSIVELENEFPWSDFKNIPERVVFLDFESGANCVYINIPTIYAANGSTPVFVYDDWRLLQDKYRFYTEGPGLGEQYWFIDQINKPRNGFRDGSVDDLNFYDSEEEVNRVLNKMLDVRMGRL